MCAEIMCAHEHLGIFETDGDRFYTSKQCSVLLRFSTAGRNKNKSKENST